jgi:hypothetical protein
MGGPVSKFLTLNLEWRQLEWPTITPKNAIPNLEWPDIIQKMPSQTWFSAKNVQKTQETLHFKAESWYAVCYTCPLFIVFSRFSAQKGLVVNKFRRFAQPMWQKRPCRATKIPLHALKKSQKNIVCSNGLQVWCRRSRYENTLSKALTGKPQGTQNQQKPEVNKEECLFKKTKVILQHQ